MKSAASSVLNLPSRVLADIARETHSARPLNAAVDLRPTVLLVDDDAFQHQIVESVLAATYRLMFARCGVEAVSMSSIRRPDLILMDLVMPGIDGLETTRRIRAMPQLAEVPVIMITGKSDDVAVRDSMKAGLSDFVLKPLDRNTLLSRIAQLLDPSGANDRKS